jgi:hypothetical protein
VHGVVRWRLVDLCQWVFEAFKVAVSTQTMSRELRAMDYRKLSARPRHHAQAAGAIEDFKKVSHRERGKGVDPGAIEIWFADEARIGQKNKITRPWAKRGTRPSAPSDQRTASTYIFGAICPREGKAVGLILPKCNTEAMQLHLDEIAKDVAPRRQAILLLDQAGWRTSRKLDVPDNLTLLPLPANVPSSTRSRPSGSSCATTGCPTAGAGG